MTDYYIDRQISNGSWAPVPRGENKYDYFLAKISETFAKISAQFESEYIFCWMDWDGDNILVDGGIIEYAHQCEQQDLPNKFIGKNFVFDERLGERISEEVVAHCHQCGKICDTHKNCANDVCHVLFIQCEECAVKYHACCSKECADFSQLPAEEQENLKGTMEFNGTRFGKGRYRALRKKDQQ
jgi:predicted sulfurtransferase